MKENERKGIEKNNNGENNESPFYQCKELLGGKEIKKKFLSTHIYQGHSLRCILENN